MGSHQIEIYYKLDIYYLCVSSYPIVFYFFSYGFHNLQVKTSHYNISPYLVHPTDRLVFGWQNIQMRNNVADSTLDEQAEADQFVDKLKNVKIVLYGSHVRGGVEYIPSMNQNLSTNQIYETILGEPVLDKFDNARMLSYLTPGHFSIKKDCSLPPYSKTTQTRLSLSCKLSHVTDTVSLSWA